MPITIEIFQGKDGIGYIETISKLRFEMFKEFPYLYSGELTYEKKYMHGYTEDKHAIIAIAKVDGELAGVSTGIPLISDSVIVADAKRIFTKANIDITEYYYYGEVFVLPHFRGLGITTKLYAAQDELIKSWGFKHTCILTVIRDDAHPLKPQQYKSPDTMWEHLGFIRNKLTTEHHWPTIQVDHSVKDVNNTLEFWVKDIIRTRDRN